MRKIVYAVAMSLDGYVAGPNGEADWIVMDPEIDFQGMMSRFDTVLMGRRTFEAAQARGGGALPGINSVVVSRTLNPADHPGLTVLSEELGAEISRLRAQSGKEILLFGGGALFRSLLELNLVDLIEVAIVPVLLGGGIPFLPPCPNRTTLKLIRNRTYKLTGTVILEYSVEREGT